MQKSVMMNMFDLAWLTKVMDGLSATQLALWCSFVLVGTTWLGIIFIKPFLRLWTRRQANSNDLVNYASAGFSLFYGLLLSLLSVAAFQNSATVEAAIDREAASIGTLYRAANSFQEPLRSELQFELRDYTNYVIYKNFPAHRRGESYNGGALRLQLIEQNIINLDPQDRAQELLQDQSLRAFNDIMDARQVRLTGVVTQIPGVLWYVVAIGAMVTIFLIWLLDVRFALHLILGGVVAFFLGVMIFLITAMDRPLQGAVSVGPEAYKVMYDRVMRWDETT